jgi:aminomethyltransferase
MGVIAVSGVGAAEGLETVMPSAFTQLAVGRNRYSFLTNDRGGVIDDLMVTNRGDHFQLVVNAATKEDDLAYLRSRLSGVEVSDLFPSAILAIQGPEAVGVLAEHASEVADLGFSFGAEVVVDGAQVWVSRSGYTGEDGLELVMAAEDAATVAGALLTDERVGLAGLAARDSLRLEAGLCLYGQDLKPEITPVEAGLTWAIQKRRRAEGGFPGADVIIDQIENGAPRRRIGFTTEKRPVREGVKLHLEDGTEVGFVSSGGFGPSVDRPIGMAYVASEYANRTTFTAHQRGKEVAVTVADLPFVPHRYAR